MQLLTLAAPRRQREGQFGEAWAAARPRRWGGQTLLGSGLLRAGSALHHDAITRLSAVSISAGHRPWRREIAESWRVRSRRRPSVGGERTCNLGWCGDGPCQGWWRAGPGRWCRRWTLRSGGQHPPGALAH